MRICRNLLSVVAVLTLIVPQAATAAPASEARLDDGQLFLGTCYQPVDRTREQILSDIAVMKKAGFRVVRIGDLSWDYFEPSDGTFDFAPFDFVMDAMAKAGIRVILDIPGTPIPLWAHQKYPGITLISEAGTPLHPAERYMDDISDPDFQRLQLRLADRIMKHYAHHPAVLAVGYSNEIGNGYLSYSPGTRQRFIAWLQKRYGNLDALNKAWASQRWSRSVSDWQQVELPYAAGPGPSERYLDLRRFWSSITIDLLRDLDAVRRADMPGKPSLSNLYDSASRRGFDYLATQADYQSYGAFGYYVGSPVDGAFQTMTARGQLTTPTWFNEFQTGFFGDYGTKGRARMSVYLGLLYGSQGFLAWTFNSHRGGEEQIYFGLLDHDGTPSWKLDELARVAGEFRTIQSLGFPRPIEPQVALSYSFESKLLADRKQLAPYYRTPYDMQKRGAFEPLFDDNIDAAVVNLGTADLSRYRLVVIPGEYLLDDKAGEAVRDYVNQGGTVIMTAYSAKADGSGQWYDKPLPGGLSDVFGLRTAQFYRNAQPLTGTIAGETFETTIHNYEFLEPSTARVIGTFTNIEGSPPTVTVNSFGKGQAIYVAATAQPAVLKPLYRSLYAKLGIARGPETPAGVAARRVGSRTLYVNTRSEPANVSIGGVRKGLISGQSWRGSLRLEGYGADLLE